MKMKKPKPENNNNNDDNPTRIQKMQNSKQKPKSSKRLTSDILLLYVNKLQRALEGLVAKVEVTTTTIRMMSGFAGVRERTCRSRLQHGSGSHGSKREGEMAKGESAKRGTQRPKGERREGKT